MDHGSRSHPGVVDADPCRASHLPADSGEILSYRQWTGRANAAHGIRIGAAVIALPAVLAIASSYGLWKEKLWGWWVALLSNTLMMGTLTYSIVDENTIDWDMVGVTAVSAVLPMLLLLPVVRKFYRAASDSSG